MFVAPVSISGGGITTRQMEQLELPLWEMLQDAAIAPDEADLAQLLDTLDASLVQLDPQSQLHVAATAIAQIAQVFCDRSLLTFEELEATASDEGPVMPTDAFDRYIRQSMTVDLDQFIEPFANLPRKTPERPAQPEETGSVVGEVDQIALLQVLDEQMSQHPGMTEADIFNQTIAIAHDEDISTWTVKIYQYLHQHHSLMSLIELVQAVKMPLSQVWLSILLGEQFVIQQHGEFYDASSILITTTSH